MKHDIYETITGQIIAELEKGVSRLLKKSRGVQ